MRSDRMEDIFNLMCPFCGNSIKRMNDSLWGLVWRLKCGCCNKDIAVYDVLSANEPVVKEYLAYTYHSLKKRPIHEVDEIYELLLDGANRELEITPLKGVFEPESDLKEIY